jgi:glucose/arabinose dehydrogenase
VAFTLDPGPTARERSRAATDRPCGRPYVELHADRLDKPGFTLVGVGRAEQPTDLAVDPRGERPTLLAEREGRVLRLDEEHDITDDAVLDLRDTSDHGDGGLLGITYDPDGEWLYVLRAAADQDDVLTAYPTGADGRPDQSGEVELLRSGHPDSEQHHGGGLAFGPDGHLYIGIGDGGGLGDPNGNAQDRGTVLGKILRIDPSPAAAEPYAIPEGNPGGDEVWAVGVRNPYRLAFDEPTGDLWLGDVGQSCWEEIDRLDPATDAGANLGWDRYEGSAPFEGGDVGSRAVWPVHTYAHRAGWCALVLGYVVREPSLPDLDGWLLHTDYCRGRVNAFRPGDGPGEPPRLVDTGLRVERPVAIVEGPDGLPWILSLEGEVFAIHPR